MEQFGLLQGKRYDLIMIDEPPISASVLQEFYDFVERRDNPNSCQITIEMAIDA